jgi:hypothetical protein
MQSLQLQPEQSKPVVCSPGSSSEKSRISAPAYGIGEHDPAVGIIRRWTPRSKVRVQVGNCRWCDAPLWKSTKPPKDCSNTCAKAFSRHVNRLDFLELKKDKDSPLGHSGGLKAIWEQLKAIDREIRKAIKEEHHAREMELRAGARRLLCKPPQSRRDFDKPANLFSRCVQCGTPFTVRVNGEEKRVFQRFPFCGETPITGGVCKAAWIAAHPNVSLPISRCSETNQRLESRYVQPVNPHAYPAPIGPRLKDGFFIKVETRRVRKAVAR